MKRLYQVTVNLSMSSKYRTSYVVADDPSKAYNMVRDALDCRIEGISLERELKTIELIADEKGLCETVLFLEDEK